MAGAKDSTVSSGWKAETEMLPTASELEFLRWFYQNADTYDREKMEIRFVREQLKAVPSIGLI